MSNKYTLIEFKSLIAELEEGCIFTDAFGNAFVDKNGIAFAFECPQPPPKLLFTDAAGIAFVDANGNAFAVEVEK